jgi:hypothetical protein
MLCLANYNFAKPQGIVTMLHPRAVCCSPLCPLAFQVVSSWRTLCLAKIKSAFELNEIRRGRVTGSGVRFAECGQMRGHAAPNVRPDSLVDIREQNAFNFLHVG